MADAIIVVASIWGGVALTAIAVWAIIVKKFLK